MAKLSKALQHSPAEQVLELLITAGDSQYGGEAVSQREHALQAAWLAEQAGASAELITAALLHDIGHLLHALPVDAPTQGVDDHHEDLAALWMAARFAPAAVEPVRLHVAAKRYLATVESGYYEQLSGPSRHSLMLQGGPMSVEEVAAFEQNPWFEAAVKLRRWDEQAKVAQLQTPDVRHFAAYVHASAVHTS